MLRRKQQTWRYDIFFIRCPSSLFVVVAAVLFVLPSSFRRLLARLPPAISPA
jgi:hypothetical protein